MGKVSIDIAGMRKLIATLERASEEIPQHQRRLVSIMEGVGVDSSPANRLSSVASWVYHELPGLRRRWALAVAIESQQLTWDRRVVFEESLVSTTPTATAIYNGSVAAAELLAAFEGFDEAGDGLPSPALLERLEAGMNDPYFAYGFAHTLTPEQLAKISHIAGERWQAHHNLVAVSSGAAPISGWGHQYERMLAAAGTTLGTATRNGGDLAMPSDYAQRWVRLITAEEATAPGLERGQAGALAVWLRHGVYSEEFILDVAESVYAYELKAGGPNVWAQRASGVPVTGDGHRGDDPLPSILHGLGNNPAAAQKFLTAEGTASATFSRTGEAAYDAPVHQRLLTLMNDRDWYPDDFGSGLAHAIAGAASLRSTDSRYEAQSRTSAEIASQAIALYAAEARGDDRLRGMRHGIATTLSVYMQDVYAAIGVRRSAGASGWVRESGDYPDQWPIAPVGAKINQSDLIAVLQDIGKASDKAAATLVMMNGMQYQLDFMSFRLRSAMLDYPGSPSTISALEGNSAVTKQLSNASTTSGASTHFLLKHLYLGGKIDEEIDAEAAARLQANLSKVAQLIPSPPHKLSAMAVSAVTSEAIDFVATPTTPASSDKWLARTHEAIGEAFRVNFYNALVSNGYFNPALDPDAGLPDGAIERTDSGQLRIRPELHSGSGGPVEISEALRSGFDRWDLADHMSNLREQARLEYMSQFDPNDPRAGDQEP